MKLRTSFRPIERWPREMTPHEQRKRSPFTAGYADTVKRLGYELDKLGAEQAIIQLAATEDQVTVDGSRPRAGVTPEHPGVIVAADTRHGWLQWPCDACLDWHDNLRAIVLTLERLRLADLYGVTARGEQYQGWKKLPAAGGATATMTAEAAASVLIRLAGTSVPPMHLLGHRWVTATTYRLACARHHPDKGGDPDLFQRLQVAKGVLDAHQGGGR